MALAFYATICHKQNVSVGHFKASTGWRFRFFSRKNTWNVKLTGENASADQVAADNFPAFLQGIIEEGGYLPDQIYDMDEAHVQYKKMPKSTFLSKAINPCSPAGLRCTVSFPRPVTLVPPLSAP